MGTGAESIVCLSVEWSTMGRILEERLLSFVMSALGKNDLARKVNLLLVLELCDKRLFLTSDIFFR